VCVGDIIPDISVGQQFELPDVKEVGEPEFEIRGLQPFHDFPEGPDWWGAEEYKAIISQIRSDVEKAGEGQNNLVKDTGCQSLCSIHTHTADHFRLLIAQSLP
jgi:hypothetical protein